MVNIAYELKKLTGALSNGVELFVAQRQSR